MEEQVRPTATVDRPIRWLVLLTSLTLAFGLAIPAQAASTVVPGHQDRHDQDDNV